MVDAAHLGAIRRRVKRKRELPVFADA